MTWPGLSKCQNERVGHCSCSCFRFNVPVHVAGLAWLAVVQVVYVLSDAMLCHAGCNSSGPLSPLYHLPAKKESSFARARFHFHSHSHFVFQFPRPQLACHSPAIIVTAPVWSVQCPVSTARWCDRIAEGLPTPSRLDGGRCYSYLSQVHGPVPSADRSDTASKVPGIF